MELDRGEDGVVKAAHDERRVGELAVGQGKIVLDMLSRFNDDFDRPRAWREALDGAVGNTLILLLQEVARDQDLFSALVRFGSARETLVEAVGRAPREVVDILADAVTSLPWYRRGYESNEIAVALAVRGFEIGEEELVQRLISEPARTLPALRASLCLSLSNRRRFVAMLGAANGLSDPVPTAFARLLTASPGDLDGASDDFVDAVSTENRARVWQQPWLFELLSPVARARLTETIVSQLTSAGEVRPYDLKGLHDQLTAEQVEQLVRGAQTYNDYDRDDLLVALLPRYAELRGYDEAAALRSAIGRSDFQALSWAALWPFLPDAERRSVLSRLMPDDPSESGHHARAVGNIARWLKDEELARAAGWIVKTHDGNLTQQLSPIIAAACERDRARVYEVWEAVVTEAARRRCAEAMAYVAETMPLVEHIAGREGLASIGQFLSRAAEQWP